MKTDMMSDPEYLESQRLTCKECKKDLSAADDHDDICNECFGEVKEDIYDDDDIVYYNPIHKKKDDSLFQAFKGLKFK